MKKILFIIAVLAVSLNACNNTPEVVVDNTEQDTEKNDSLNLKGLREFDLKDHELNATILVPEAFDENSFFIQPDILHQEGEARWEITIKSDKRWHMVIEDWGNENLSTATEKNEHLDKGDIFDFIYEEEGENYLLYSKVLKSENTTLSEAEAKMLPNYHFYCVQKIDGSTIVLRSHEMGEFRGLTARKMLTSARMLKANPKM